MTAELRDSTALSLFIAPRPFSPHLLPREVAAGTSIGRMLTQALNDGALDADDLERVRVYVDGVGLPLGSEDERRAAFDAIPPAGAHVLLAVEPEGSNASARGALSTLFNIIGAVASFTVGPFTSAMWFLAAATVPNLLFPIRAPDRLESANDRGALQGAQNTVRRRDMMPLQLGKSREAFDVAAAPFTRLIGNDVWLTVIFGVHYGPCVVENIRIGETALADYPAADVRIVQHLTPGPRDFTLYPARVGQENLSDKLTLGGDYEVHTTGPNAERIEVDLTWPSGLRYNKENGSILPQETRIEVQWQALDENGDPVGAYAAAPLEGGPFKGRTGATLPTGQIEIQGRTQDALRRTLAWNTGSKGRYNVRIRAWDPDGDDPSKAVQDVYWTALRAIETGKPITDETLSVIEMQLRSSDDLSGQLPVVTAEITPLAPVWDAEAGEWRDDPEDWAPTSNAAALARMLLIGPAAARPMGAADFDASCEDAYELIEARGWHAGYRLAQQTTQEEALQVLGAMGRFSVHDTGAGLRFVTDWEKPATRQLFTGRNVQGYRFSRTFPDAVHAVIVEFRNVDESSEADELIVFADGYAEEAGDGKLAAELYETLRIPFACDPDRAYREGRCWLAKRIHQVERHEWTSAADGLVAAPGDRVAVAHRSALFGVQQARVVQRHMASGQVTGLRLDEYVEMEAGASYALDVRRGDTFLAGVDVTTRPGRTRDLYFPSPLAPEAAPEAGDLVAFGVAGEVTEDLELVEVEPQPGNTVRLAAVKYIADILEAAETGPIPPFVTKVTARPRAPTPRILGVQGDPNGVRVVFDIDPVRGALLEGFSVRWRRAMAEPSPDEVEPGWVTLPPLGATAREVITPPVFDAAAPAALEEAEWSVDVEIRSVLRSGSISTPAVAHAVRVARTVSAPVNFTATGVTRTAPDGSSYGAIAVACDPLEAGPTQTLEVELTLANESPELWRSAGGFPSRNPAGDCLGVQGGGEYDVRGRWRTQDNWVSEWATVTGVTVPAGSDVAADTANVNGRPSLDITQALDDLADAQSDFWDRLDGIDGPGGALAGLQSAIDSLNETIGDPVTGLSAAHAEIQALDEAKAEKMVVSALTARTVVVEGQSVPPGLLTGGSGDLVLTPNMTGSGPNAGEIRVEGTYINHPTLGRTAITAGELLSQFEGSGPVPPGGRFYVIWSGQALADRFDPPLTGTLGRLFTAAYDWESGVWTAYGNTGDGQTFALVENDLLVAVCGRTSSAGGSGIDWLRPAFSQLAAIDARIGGLETVVTTPTTGLASRLAVLEAEINTPETGLAAVVAEHTAVIADLDENYASASRVTDIEAEIAAARDGHDSLNARIVDAAEAAASDTQAVAQTLSVLQARTVAPGVNLIANPSGQRGLDGWTATGGDWSALPDGGFAIAPGTGAVRLDNDFFPCSPGQKVSAQAEMWVEGLSSGAYRVYLQWWSDSAQIGASIDVALHGADTEGWVRSTLDGQEAPEGTTRARLCLVRSGAVNAEAIGRWRRVKAEIGERATTYSEDALGLAFGATIGAHQTAIVDLEANKVSAATFGVLQAEVQNARGGELTLSARLSSLDQAISDETSARASQFSQLSAQITTNPNLLKNSTLANGTDGWPLGAGWARFADADGTGFVNAGNDANRNGYSDYYDLSELGLAPGDWMSVSAEFALTGRTTGSVVVRLDFWDASTQLSTIAMANRGANGDFPGRAGSAVQIPVGATRFRVRVACNALNTGATARIRRIKVEKGQQQTAWTDDRLSQDMASAVTEAAEALVDLENDYALARWVKKAEATGGRPALLGLTSASEGPSGVTLAADQIWLGDNTYFDDASNTFITDAAGLRMILMGPFGAAGDLTMWQGPDTVSPAAATKANAWFYLSTTPPYVGGQQLRGWRKDTKPDVDVTSATLVDVHEFALSGFNADDFVAVQFGLNGEGAWASSPYAEGDWEIRYHPDGVSSGNGRILHSGTWRVVPGAEPGDPVECQIRENGALIDLGDEAYSSVSPMRICRFDGDVKFTLRMSRTNGISANDVNTIIRVHVTPGE